MSHHELTAEELEEYLQQLHSSSKLVEALLQLSALDFTNVRDELAEKYTATWDELYAELTNQADASRIEHMLFSLHYMFAVFTHNPTLFVVTEADISLRAESFRPHPLRASLQGPLMTILLQEHIRKNKNTFTHFFMNALLSNNA